MDNFTETSQSYRVQSSFIASVTWGQVDFGQGLSTTALLVTFLNGAQYIYIGVYPEVATKFQAAVNLNLYQDHSIGRAFNEYIRPLTCYARLHSSI